MNALNSDAYLTETRNLYSCSSINSENISQILRRASILPSDGGRSYTEARGNYHPHYPEEGEQLEVYQITHNFWGEAGCFNLETQDIDAGSDTLNFQEIIEFDIIGDQE
ncbi:MAG: hypothetical protein BRC29_02670 [Nanohaloarchaea archaeon SW_7_43_1]|nr:MAG: hypothetical protein BRC29_02670 [Nanohaloarchaea archaeon SW_7_43_1]